MLNSFDFEIEAKLEKKVKDELSDTMLFISPKEFTGDNAFMIAVAGYIQDTLRPRVYDLKDISAEGNMKLSLKK